MLNNLKIKTLVISVLAVLIALMIAIGALGIYGADYSVGVVRDVSLADQKNISSQTAIRLEMELGRCQILQAEGIERNIEHRNGL